MAKKKYDPVIGLRLSPELNDRLEKIARRFGISRSDVIRIGLGQTVPLIEQGKIDLKLSPRR